MANIIITGVHAAALPNLCIQADHLHCLTTIGPPTDIQMGKQLSYKSCIAIILRRETTQHLYTIVVYIRIP